MTPPTSNLQPPTSNFQLPASIPILGVPVHDVTNAGTLDLIDRFVAERTPHQLCSVNPEFVMAAQHDAEFMRVLNHSAVNFPDGVGLLWAARRMGRPLHERVAGSDLTVQIAALSARKGWRIFLLGAGHGVAELAATKLRAQYPGVNIVGALAGSPAVDREDPIVDRVRQAAPDILLVAYGAPKQDKWIARNIERIGAPVAIGIGGSLDFIAGVQRRAPRWMQRIGLEWLYRLVREPWRWRRQSALPRFVWRVLCERRRRRKMGEGERGR